MEAHAGGLPLCAFRCVVSMRTVFPITPPCRGLAQRASPFRGRHSATSPWRYSSLVLSPRISAGSTASGLIGFVLRVRSTECPSPNWHDVRLSEMYSVCRIRTPGPLLASLFRGWCRRRTGPTVPAPRSPDACRALASAPASRRRAPRDITNLAARLPRSVAQMRTPGYGAGGA